MRRRKETRHPSRKTSRESTPIKYIIPFEPKNFKKPSVCCGQKLSFEKNKSKPCLPLEQHNNKKTTPSLFSGQNLFGLATQAFLLLAIQSELSLLKDRLSADAAHTALRHLRVFAAQALPHFANQTPHVGVLQRQ